MKTSILKILRKSKSLKEKHLYYIENSFLYPYHNGRIEGVNNKIKILNRIAYGYKDFYDFKNRIMLHFKLRPASKQKETHSKAA